MERWTEEEVDYLLSGVPVIVFRFDPSQGCRLTYMGTGVRERFGYSPEDFTEDVRFWPDHVHPEDRSSFEKSLESLREKKELKRRYRFLHSNGTYCWTRDWLKLFSAEDAEGVRGIGCWLDETARMRARRAFLRSKERFRLAFEKAPIGMAIINEDLRYRKVNKAFCRILGLSKSELLRLTLKDLTHPDDLDKNIALAQKALRGEISSFQLEKRYVRKSDEIIWAKLTGAFLREGEEGAPFWLGMVEDITERKQAEEALQEREELFRQMAENIEEVFWLSDIDFSKVIYVNPAYERVWGRSSRDLYANPRTWLKAVHPEDRNRVMEAFSKRKADETLEIIFRILRPDGSLRWILDCGFPVFDEAGRPCRLVGLAQDITDLKRTELELEARVAGEKLLAEMGLHGLERRTIASFLEEAADAVTRILSVPCSLVLVLRPDAKEFIVGAEAGLPDGYSKNSQVRFGEDPVASYALSSGSPVVVEDLGSEDRFGGAGFLRKNGITSCLALPIGSSRKPEGVLGAYDRVRRSFSENDVHFMQGLANLIAAKIERRRVYEQLSGSEAALRRSQAQLRALNANLIAVQEQERGRISRDLHDDLNQQVALVSMEVEELLSESDFTTRDKVAARLRHLHNRVEDLSDGIHRIAHRLHPTILDHLGLKAALRNECSAVSKREKIEVHFVDLKAPEKLPPDVALSLYRIAQEALRNAAKHARAAEVVVILDGRQDGVSLIVRDDGVGFDPKAVRGRGGLGLTSMEERARLVSGSVTVKSEPGHGTEVCIRIPLSGIAGKP